MEKKSYLVSEERRVGRTARRVYRATPLDREALKMTRGKVRELFGEMIHDHRAAAPLQGPPGENFIS
jgi:DNA-binding PadR family transcriptional regulator